MIKKVVRQLSKENYDLLCHELEANRGEKFVKLIDLYRTTEFEDNDIRDEIGLNPTSYYTLKSRLLDKTQEFLFRNANDNRVDLLKNISSIPYLIHHTPRETAIILLQHLETELMNADMPRELITVYNGLKKLNLQTEQYFHYQQLYNKAVAYSLSIDKADELLSTFNRELVEFMLSGDRNKIDILELYIKELKNINKLYNSHRLYSFVLLASISFGLYTGDKNEISDSQETTEELLKTFQKILEKNASDNHYKSLSTVWHFLNFEYYMQLSLYKNGAASFQKVNDDVQQFLLLGHTCPAPKFLLSKIEFIIHSKDKETLFQRCAENPMIFDKQNPTEYIYLSLFSATCHFHDKKYQEGAAVLNNCMNEISFKNYPFAEFQIKLFQTLLLILAEKMESAEIVYRSVSRKLQTEDFPDRFPQSVAFSKFLKLAINDNTATKSKKLKEAYSSFNLINNGLNKILAFAPINEHQFLQLSK